MTPRNARGRVTSFMGARAARVARGARENLDEGDNHQESVMGEKASAIGGNIRGVDGIPPVGVSGA